MAHYLTPHTDEWFSLLAKINPAQSEMTKTIIKLAGNPECCSICGDEEDVSDYFLSQKSDISKDAVLTLRLCKDCVQIRKQMNGETFLPFDLRS
jgi:hypothetical protein